MTSSNTATPATHRIGWHYWQLCVPNDWNPAQLDGDYASGSVLLADLTGPRLGVRWTSCRPQHAAAAVERSLRSELGATAAMDAIDFPLIGSSAWEISRMAVASDRCLWVGYSPSSRRLFQIVYHAVDNADTFTDAILPTADDRPTDRSFCWSVFDLTFTTPPGWHVRSSRFLAGDLSVSLTRPDGSDRAVYVLRQVGPASLALARQPLEKWLTHQPFSTPKLYRTIADVEPITLQVNGRPIEGRHGTLRRKHRLWWAWFLASPQHVIGCHDVERDRLVFAQGTDPSVLQKLLKTLGAFADA